MRWLRRVAAALLVFVVVLAGVAGAGIWWSMPVRGGTWQVPELSAAVTITVDGDGIPRIRAQTAEDGAAALGYMHARDRLFQMDLMRRAVSGRLSEVLGGMTLPFDRSMRVLGLRPRAEKEWAAMTPGPRGLLDAYARGVNAFIAAHGRFASPEFALLGAPEPWAPADTILWGKTMGLFLSGNYRTELARAALLARGLPPGTVGGLWPNPPADEPTAEAALAGRLLDLLPAFPAPFTLPSSASDEWAVDARHSATGAPLLAGDPHLAFNLPGLWYLARIDTPGGVLAGATAPGVPMLVIGRNSRIAWTFTTTGADTQDLFRETVLPDGRYATPDGPAAFAVREERIHVRFGADEVLHVRETRHGPVISDLNGAPDGPVLALAAANLAAGDTAVQGLYALNGADSVAEAGRAAGLISSPVQNLLAADHDGIGLFTTGRVPVRRAGDGTMPVNGADGGHDWTGWASGEALPRVVDPPSGRLVNGNERTVGPGFPVFLGADWFAPWRADRIRALLDERPLHDPGEFAAMQVDDVSAFAERVLPRLHALPDPGGPAGRAVALLAGWNGRMSADAPQPLIFNAWMARFEAALLAGRNLPHGLTGTGADLIGHVLLDNGAAEWCADGDCRPLLLSTEADAVADLSARFGPDPATWRWGAAHVVRFSHPLLGMIPGLRHWAGVAVSQGGSDTTLERGSPADGSFQSTHGAEYRGVYDLADLDRSLFMAAPGQSGHPLSPHYTDLAERWRDGNTLMLGPVPATVEETITLRP